MMHSGSSMCVGGLCSWAGRPNPSLLVGSKEERLATKWKNNIHFNGGGGREATSTSLIVLPRCLENASQEMQEAVEAVGDEETHSL